MTSLQRDVQRRITELFAPEDDGLRNALALASEAGLPDIQISPLQGRFLQFLATACNAKQILEIGSLAGYSGIWLARALPSGGRLITLEANELHVDLTRRAFVHAGVEDRTDVRQGNALDILPLLQPPFDLIFIDADKKNSPQYLEWAVRLSRPGTIIIADNSIPGGTKLRFPEPGSDTAIEEYTQRLVSNTSLVSIALALDEQYTDGFAMAVVRQDA